MSFETEGNGNADVVLNRTETHRQQLYDHCSVVVLQLLEIKLLECSVTEHASPAVGVLLHLKTDERIPAENVGLPAFGRLSVDCIVMIDVRDRDDVRYTGIATRKVSEYLGRQKFLDAFGGERTMHTR